MERQIVAQLPDGGSLAYTLRFSKRAKRMRLAVHGDGSVVVTAPSRLRLPAAQSFAERFVAEKRSWLLAKIAAFSRFAGQPLHRQGQAARADYGQHKESARRLAAERATHFAERYGVSFQKISIRNQRTRWGSCSRKGNLSFNYKIALLPPRLADYIVAHEVCHLREMNHSNRFWQLVAMTIPDYAAIRKEFKQSGLSFY